MKNKQITFRPQPRIKFMAQPVESTHALPVQARRICTQQGEGKKLVVYKQMPDTQVQKRNKNIRFTEQIQTVCKEIQKVFLYRNEKK